MLTSCHTLCASLLLPALAGRAVIPVPHKKPPINNACAQVVHPSNQCPEAKGSLACRALITMAEMSLRRSCKVGRARGGQHSRRCPESRRCRQAHRRSPPLQGPASGACSTPTQAWRGSGSPEDCTVYLSSCRHPPSISMRGLGKGACGTPAAVPHGRQSQWHMSTERQQRCCLP